MAKQGDADDPGQSRPGELSVEVDRLRRFGEQLARRADGLRQRSGDLDVIDHLTDDRSIHGDFPEALSLAEANRDAIEVMDALVLKVGEVVGFADEVATGTAHDFEAGDLQAEADFANVANELDLLAQRYAT